MIARGILSATAFTDGSYVHHTSLSRWVMSFQRSDSRVNLYFLPVRYWPELMTKYSKMPSQPLTKYSKIWLRIKWGTRVCVMLYPRVSYVQQLLFGSSGSKWAIFSSRLPRTITGQDISGGGEIVLFSEPSWVVVSRFFSWNAQISLSLDLSEERTPFFWSL